MTASLAGFPMLNEYLGQLPEGIDSYPRVLGSSASLTAVLKLLPLKQPVPELPASLNAFLTGGAPARWIPKVHFYSMISIAYDVQFAATRNLAGFEKWILLYNRDLFSGPFYRLLFTLVSPKMVIDGAQKRWSSFFAGMTLDVVERSSTSCTLQIGNPPGLLGPLVPHLFPQVFRCVVEMAGGKDVFAHAQAIDTCTSRYWLRWK